jgi:ParB family chromosome partitioning protein
LGKGLSALLDNAATDITTSSASSAGLGSVSLIPIEAIEANPFNPRTHFDTVLLKELSESIAIHGLIQPLTVRKLGRDKYQLISGERRFRASQLAGLKEVPAYVRVANDQSMLEMALVENIQREDLNAIEVALSYQLLIEEIGLTQDQLTNHLRLLKLPAEIQLGVRDTLISMGHARALVSAGEEEKQLELYRQIVDHQLSVREVEEMIKSGTKRSVEPASTPSSTKETEVSLTPAQDVFRLHLSDKISSKVSIKKNADGNGKISISFSSEVDLNRIIEILNK